jgi:hypothetical protein
MGYISLGARPIAPRRNDSGRRQISRSAWHETVASFEECRTCTRPTARLARRQSKGDWGPFAVVFHPFRLQPYKIEPPSSLRWLRALRSSLCRSPACLDLRSDRGSRLRIFVSNLQTLSSTQPSPSTQVGVEGRPQQRLQSLVAGLDASSRLLAAALLLRSASSSSLAPKTDFRISSGCASDRT